MRALFVVTSAISELGGKLSSGDSERGFVGRIAFAENDQANVVREQAIQNRDENVETFFTDYAGDHSENRPARRGVQSQTIQQRVTAKLFSPKFRRGVICRKQFVGFRIPTRVIGAVQNRTELMRVFAQNDIQPATELRRLDLAPMPLAHGRDSVSEQNSAFEEIEFSEKLDATEGKESFVQVRQPKIEAPKTSLLRNVMNGQDSRERQVVRAHVNGHKGGRPIVHVQNLRSWS